MYKMVNGRKRIFYLDFIRALAIILVLSAHITRLFYNNAPHSANYMHLVAPMINVAIMGVPLFLMISGALLLNRKYELGDFLKRRYKRVLIPFLFWSVVTIILRIFLDNQAPSPSNILTMFFDDYWYVWMILGVYLFIPIINAFIENYGIKGVEYFLAIWTFVIILDTAGLYPFHNFELGNFAGYLGYLVLGYYLSNKEFRISDSNMAILSLVVLLIITIFSMEHTVSISYMKHRLSYYGYQTIEVVIQSAAMYLFIRYFSQSSAKTPGSIKNKVYSFFKDTFMFKIIFTISTFSYGIYLAHYISLYSFKWIDKYYFPVFSHNPLKWFPIILLAFLVITIVILWILDKIPGLRNITGAN